MTSKKYWVASFKLSIVMMAIVFIVKALVVLYYGSRDISLGYPFDTFNFDASHRFTDYLLIWKSSHLPNIYDLSDPFYTNLPPAPYTFLQFALLRYVPFPNAQIVKYIYFLIYLAAFVYIVRNIFLDFYKFRDKEVWYLFFLITCFPLHFEIDRGNVDIIAAFLLSLVVYFVTKSNDRQIEKFYPPILLIVISALKPTFLIYLLPLLLCYRFFYFLSAIVFIGIVYYIPIGVYDAPYNYMVSGISGALKLIDKQILFCSNFLCGLRSIRVFPDAWLAFSITVVSLFILLPVTIYKVIKITDHKKKTYFALLFTSLLLLVLNDPSPDYRLIFLIPLLFAAPKFIPIETTFSVKIIALLIVVIFGYININFHVLRNYTLFYGFIRSVALLFVLIWTLRNCNNISCTPVAPEVLPSSHV